MKCKLCGKKLEVFEVDYCITCRVFLDWKYSKKIHERLKDDKEK